MNILYITKLENSFSNGVTVAVMQLLNMIVKYANVFWLDIENINLDVNKKIKKVRMSNYMDFNYDIAVIEDPFNSLVYCEIANNLNMKKIPYILAPHGCFHKEALKRKWLKKKIAINTVFRKYLNGCYGTQFLTENEQKSSIHFNESIIIPNGIEVRRTSRVPSRIRKIVFIGRKDVEHKGIDLLIEAVTKVKDELKKSECEIVLYGPTNNSKDDKYIADKILSNNLKDIVISKEAVFGNEKEKVLCSSDAYIQTSRHEGFPMSILEALAYGLPVLVTEGTNMMNIIKENNAGFVCGNNIDEIANMIKEAISCKNTNILSRNAKELAQKYTWDEISKTTIKKYETIITERKNER